MRSLAICTAVLGSVLAIQMAWGQAVTQMPTESSVAQEADQARLNELMNLIAEEMAALNETENRQERDALMAMHRQHMREAMALMSGMGGDSMGRMMEHMAAREPSEGASRAPRHVHRRPMARRSQMSDATRLMDLETRVDMLQTMMESMLEQSATDEWWC